MQIEDQHGETVRALMDVTATAHLAWLEVNGGDEWPPCTPWAVLFGEDPTYEPTWLIAGLREAVPASVPNNRIVTIGRTLFAAWLLTLADEWKGGWPTNRPSELRITIELPEAIEILDRAALRAARMLVHFGIVCRIPGMRPGDKLETTIIVRGLPLGAHPCDDGGGDDLPS